MAQKSDFKMNISMNESTAEAIGDWHYCVETAFDARRYFGLLESSNRNLTPCAARPPNRFYRNALDALIQLRSGRTTANVSADIY